MKFGRGLAICIAFVAIAGCSNDPEVSKTSLEKQLFDQLTEAIGFKPQSVTCPGGLPANRGAEQKCVMKFDGTDYKVDVEVATLKGENVEFDVNMGWEPVSATPPEYDGPIVPEDDLVNAVSQYVEAQTGAPPTLVVCPDVLPIADGKKTTCYLHEGKDVWDVTVTAANVDGNALTFDIKVADNPR